MIWVLIDYSNGYWKARGIEGLKLHDVAQGHVHSIGTSVGAYERLQEDVMRHLKQRFPGEKTLIPMWLHTNSAKSRLSKAEAERARAA